MTTLTEVTDETFEDKVLNSNGLVLIDFWADWCGPCKAIAPILEQVSDHFGDKLSIYKLNIDNSPEIAAKFKVRGIPTLILFKNGESESSKMGLLSKSDLITFVDSYL
ncbi:MAG: thioredoxin [Endozoicomonadaceae bacterium]|nr:thioredoxin [Endozoicomonadaceae bacterium]